MAISKNFEQFMNDVNEASLKGNIGIPGEGNTQGPSWLDKTNREQQEKVRDFERNNMGLLQNFPRFIQDSQRLQSGKETELSELCEKAFYQLFGTLLNDVTLDFKIGNEARQMMSGTPEAPPRQSIEEIVDERVLDEIMKRKILRTIQQGKGLNSKALLNLPLFKDGIKEILGTRSQSYIDNLNNIVKVMAFFDATLSEAQISRAIKSNAQGACDIEIEEKKKDEEETQKDAEQLIKDLENGIDLTETESDILSEVEVRIKARGVDLGILIHESLKGIYKLCTQMSLEHLPEEIAKQVLQNTDTTLDEPQEFKYGPSMQKQFEMVVNTHPKVKIIIDNLQRNITNPEKYEEILDDKARIEAQVKAIAAAENQLASFQEQLFFYVFGFLAAMGKDDPKEMLKAVYGVLADKKDDIESLFFPIVASSVASLEQEFKYQQSKSSPTKAEVTKAPVSGEKTLSDLQEELDDAEDNEDYERAAEIRDEIKKRFPNK
jgi:hypothetical protein